MKDLDGSISNVIPIAPMAIISMEQTAAYAIQLALNAMALLSTIVFPARLEMRFLTSAAIQIVLPLISKKGKIVLHVIQVV